MGGSGRILFDTSHPRLPWGISRLGVTISLPELGWAWEIGWGRHTVDLPAGAYRIVLWTRFLGPHGLGQCGVAESLITIRPGEHLNYYYRAPAFLHLPGALGRDRQRTPGGAARVALLLVPCALLPLTLAALLAMFVAL